MPRRNCGVSCGRNDWAGNIKTVLHRKLRDINAPLSGYSFPNLYLFRDSHRYEVMFDKGIFIKCREDALDFWRAPLYSKQLLTL
jgi:hypothetical protein